MSAEELEDQREKPGRPLLRAPGGGWGRWVTKGSVRGHPAHWSSGPREDGRAELPVSGMKHRPDAGVGPGAVLRETVDTE